MADPDLISTVTTELVLRSYSVTTLPATAAHCCDRNLLRPEGLPGDLTWSREGVRGLPKLTLGPIPSQSWYPAGFFGFAGKPRSPRGSKVTESEGWSVYLEECG